MQSKTGEGGFQIFPVPLQDAKSLLSNPISTIKQWVPGKSLENAYIVQIDTVSELYEKQDKARTKENPKSVLQTGVDENKFVTAAPDQVQISAHTIDRLVTLDYGLLDGLISQAVPIQENDPQHVVKPLIESLMSSQPLSNVYIVFRDTASTPPKEQDNSMIENCSESDLQAWVDEPDPMTASPDRVQALARAILGDAAFDHWMTSEHVFLGGRTPQAILEEEDGSQQITKLLIPMAFGGFS